MLIKYFYPNKDDKIEFTRKELEKLINDVYEEGRTEGTKVWIGNPTITTPYYPPIIYNEKPFDTTPYIYCTDTNSIGATTLETVNGIIGNYQGEQINVIGNNK